jgi:hypothetical protein
MPYPFLGVTGRSYVQYLDTDTGRMLITEPGGTYTMQPVPGAGNVPVPPGDGLWGDETTLDTKPAAQPPAQISAPPGAPDQPARKNGNGKETTAASAALEGSE